GASRGSRKSPGRSQPHPAADDRQFHRIKPDPGEGGDEDAGPHPERGRALAAGADRRGESEEAREYPARVRAVTEGSGVVSDRLTRMLPIEQRVQTLKSTTDRGEAVKTIGLLLAELEKGTIRAAVRDADGVWNVATWVKEGILAAFKFGVLAEFASGSLSFIDKDTIPARRFKVQDGVRIVPGGSSIRRGAFLGKGVVMMPPAFVNIGAY